MHIKFEESINEDLKQILPYRDKFLSDGLYNKIRRRVMHPVRPILDDKIEINDLNEFLTDYTSIMNSLSVNR